MANTAATNKQAEENLHGVFKRLRQAQSMRAAAQQCSGGKVQTRREAHQPGCRPSALRPSPPSWQTLQCLQDKQTACMQVLNRVAQKLRFADQQHISEDVAPMRRVHLLFHGKHCSATSMRAG
jgi:hypothetical protein